MARLQDLLSQSVTQSLGLSDILEKRQEEAIRSGEVQRLQGQVQAAAIRGEARKERAMFETVGTLLGGAAGFAFGGPAGATLGAQLGQAAGGDLSGKAPDPRASRTSNQLQQALNIGIQTQALLGEQKSQGDLTQSQINLNRAKTASIMAPIVSPSGKREQSALSKKVLDVQASGKGVLATDLSDEALKSLPNSAFFNLTLGDESVRMVKSPKPLSAEAAAKFAVARKARSGAQELLEEIHADPLAADTLRLSNVPGVKIFGSTQKARARLKLISEGLGRALSGAQIPESELKNFKELFAVNLTDSFDMIDFKLRRSIEIVDDLENSMKFGASISDVQDYLKGKENAINSFSGASNVSSEAVPVAVTSDGRVRFSDGTILSQEDADIIEERKRGASQ